MARVLVTRPRPGAETTARRLAELGFDAAILPLTKIVPLTPPPLVAAPIAAVAATSANAVRSAPAELVGRLRETRLFAVGAETARAAAKAGFVKVEEGAGDAESLAALVTAELIAGDRVLFLCGRERLSAFERRVGDAGIVVELCETYDTIAAEPSVAEVEGLGTDPIDAALVYSRGTARGLCRLMARSDARGIMVATRLFCLSPRIAEAFDGLDAARIRISPHPNETALLHMLRDECGNAP